MRTVRVLMALLAVVFWIQPALAAKVPLADDELDLITAAGEPTVITVEATTGEAEATFLDESTFALDLPEHSQQGLRALTLVNVVGEVQLLVNLNVLSAQNTVLATDQRNFAVQSWGSTMPFFESFEPVVPCSVPETCNSTGGAGGVAGDGGDADAETGGTGGAGGTNTITTGDNSPVNGTITADGGAGGNASSSPGGSGGDANGGQGGTIQVFSDGQPGEIETASASGDVIVTARGGSSAKATVTQKPVFALSFEPEAQTDLAALFIANIVGRAQVAYNINIAAATLNLIPDPSEPFSEPVANAGTIKQVNSGVQFRGTPLGFGNTSLAIDVQHTPN